MYCPTCGTTASAEQKFCRACGTNLQIVSQALSGQLTTSVPNDLMSVVQELRSRRRKMFRWGFITFWGGIIVAALLGVIGGALESINPPVGEAIAALSGLGGIILLIGIGMMIYSAFLPKVSGPTSSAQSPALSSSASPTGTPMPPSPEPVPSVTEHTTVKLESPQPETAPRPSKAKEL